MKKKFSGVVIFVIFPSWLLALLLIHNSLASEALDPQFTIKVQDQKITYTRSQLLSRSDVTPVEVTEDPSYPGKKMLYQAIPLSNLFQGVQVPSEGILQFRCLDGFSGYVPKDKALSTSAERPKAFLAIESPKTKWPALNPPTNNQTAGPFVLIWTYPAKGMLIHEEWPFQLVGLEVKQSAREAFPLIFPDKHLAQNHPAVRGFKVFQRACFSCHTMNHQGESAFGPDLNMPASPVEYFSQPYLKALIRDSKSVRSWPSQKMKTYTKEELSDAELDDVIAYLRHMKKIRPHPAK